MILLAQVPTLAGILLHIAHGIVLVDNFKSEDGLDDVFEGDDALERTIFVDDAGKLTVASPSFFREIRRVSHCDTTTTG